MRMNGEGQKHVQTKEIELKKIIIIELDQHRFRDEVDDDELKRTNEVQTEELNIFLCQSQEFNLKVGKSHKEFDRELRDFHIGCEEVLTELKIAQEEIKRFKEKIKTLKHEIKRKKSHVAYKTENEALKKEKAVKKKVYYHKNNANVRV